MVAGGDEAYGAAGIQQGVDRAAMCIRDSIKPVLTAGHTNGTDSFIFELTDPATNETLTISYLGGYGVNGNTKYDPDNDPTGRGYLRLAFQYGLRYLQQTVEPDYMLPQHTFQFW